MRQVIKKMVARLCSNALFGNPSSILHRQGRKASNNVEHPLQLLVGLCQEAGSREAKAHSWNRFQSSS
jgi:hypothetical protein